jgi:ADP-ribose pyrophosphatase YjhB (NUDIX family)
MTTDAHGDGPSNPVEPITDTDALRDRDDVPYHEPVDIVPEEVVDRMDDLPDLASVGITNDDGVLLRRLTETCSWKIPTASVAPEEDFTAAIRDHVSETVGLTVELVSVAGVWDVTVETEGGNHSATRTFVVFEGAVPSGDDDLDAVRPAEEPVEAADWFDELPDGADEIPGTDRFFD